METVKINFTLEVDDGFPPIGVETLNARPCEDGTFELLNTPFFVKETAFNDIVRATENENGRLEFVECVRESSFRAIAIIFWTLEVRERLISELEGKNCVTEYGEFPGYKMLAIAVPHSTNYDVIQSLLDDYEKSNGLSYAELVA